MTYYYLRFDGDGPIHFGGIGWSTPTSDAWTNPCTYDMTVFASFEEANRIRETLCQFKSKEWRAMVKIVRVTNAKRPSDH